MSRSLRCARPGCGGEAVAWLTYGYAVSTVWLDDSPGDGGDEWGMCAEHAGRLRAPRGWRVLDRRVGRAVRALAS